MPLPPHAIPLLFDAMHALTMSMNDLARELGSSRSTGQRWSAGRAHPSDDQIHTLARRVYPVDPALARKLAGSVGTTLEALGIPQRGAPPSPPPIPDRIVDAVVYAAAEAVDLPPRAIRPGVVAAFAAARELGLSVEAVDGVLRKGSAPSGKAAKAKG
jgi:hypothetical protein